MLCSAPRRTPRGATWPRRFAGCSRPVALETGEAVELLTAAASQLKHRRPASTIRAWLKASARRESVDTGEAVELLLTPAARQLARLSHVNPTLAVLGAMALNPPLELRALKATLRYTRPAGQLNGHLWTSRDVFTHKVRDGFAATALKSTTCCCGTRRAAACGWGARNAPSRLPPDGGALRGQPLDAASDGKRLKPDGARWPSYSGWAYSEPITTE